MGSGTRRDAAAAAAAAVAAKGVARRTTDTAPRRQFGSGPPHLHRRSALALFPRRGSGGRAGGGGGSRESPAAAEHGVCVGSVVDLGWGRVVWPALRGGARAIARNAKPPRERIDWEIFTTKNTQCENRLIAIRIYCARHLTLPALL